MKRFVKSFILVLLMAGMAYGAGSWATYNWTYKPQLTTQGTTDYTQFNLSQDKIDAKLHSLAVNYGDPGYTTLAEALTTIGVTNAELVIPSANGAVTVVTGTTVPGNVYLNLKKGAYLDIPAGATATLNGPITAEGEVAHLGAAGTLTVNGQTRADGLAYTIGNSSTLTINGPIDAGPHQIFSWGTGSTINLQGCPTRRCYLQWWGAVEGSSGDIHDPLLKAYQSLEVLNYGTDVLKAHDIVVTSGIWYLKTPLVYVPAAGWTASSHWLPNLVGEDQYGSVLYMSVGGSSDGITLGGNYGGADRWIQGTWIKNLTVLGDVSGCRHAFYLANWNVNGGMDDVNIACGSTASAVFCTSCENSHWNIRFGVGPNRYATGNNPNYAGFEAAPVTGVGFETGLSTMAYLRVHQTFTAHSLYAIKLVTSGGVKIDDSDIEGVSGGEIQDYYTNGVGPYIPLYSGAITKIGQTFTLTDTTTIENIRFDLNVTGTPAGKVSFTLYNTVGGAPSGAPIYTSWKTMIPVDLNSGGAFGYIIPMGKRSLAAGTYFAAVEFSGGDASNYVGAATNTSYGSYQGANSSTCYTYSGAAWSAQSYTIGHAVNSGAAIWLDTCSAVFIKSHHIETPDTAYRIDNCLDCEINNQYIGGGLEVFRSRNIKLGGVNNYFYIKTDPVSSILLESNRSPLNSDAMQDAGYTIYQGYLTDWFNRVPADVKGNGYSNLMINTLLNRWQAAQPDSFSKSATMTWTKCGTGLADTTKHPLTDFCAKLEESKATAEGWTFGSLTGDDLNTVKGKWLCYSIYTMIPSGQTLLSDSYISAYATVPAWANATQYNIGDGANNGYAICVQPGISGAVEPTWAASGTYQVDGTVVWLNWGNILSTFTLNSSFSDDIWRRIGAVAYVATNATGVSGTFTSSPQVGPANSTQYFTLPQINLGRMPLMAPMPYSGNSGKAYFNGLAVMADTVIPSDGSSKYIGDYHNLGDTCYQIGGSGVSRCTGAGTPGTWSAF